MDSIPKDDRRFHVYGGRIIARGDKISASPIFDELPPEKLRLQLRNARRVRITGDGDGYSVSFEDKPVRSGVTRKTALVLADRISRDPELFAAQHRGKIGIGEHGLVMFARNLVEAALRDGAKDAALHGPCRVIDPATGDVVRVIPANSSTPRKKTAEQWLEYRAIGKRAATLVAAE